MRYAKVLGIILVVVVLVVGGGYWLVRAALSRSGLLSATEITSPEPVIPVYPEPANNGFADLAAAGAPLQADHDAIRAVFGAPSDQRRSMAEAVLSRHRANLEAARAALSRGCLLPRPSSLEDTYPYLTHLRLMSRLLVLEGKLHEEDGRADEASASYETALRLAPAVTTNGLTSHARAGATIVEGVAPFILYCVGTGGVSPDALENMGSALDEIAESIVPLHESVAVEYDYANAALDATARSAVTPDLKKGTAPRASGAAVVLSLASAARDEQRQVYGELIAELQKPAWEWSYEMPEERNTLTQLPLLGGLGRSIRLRDMLIAGLRVHVALQRYRADSGAYPTRLDELVPVYLAELPVDPHTGEQFTYTPTDGTYWLYGAGKDGVAPEAEGGTLREGDDRLIWGPYALSVDGG